MAEIIKGNSLFNTIIIDGTVEISNKIAGLDDAKSSEGEAQTEEEKKAKALEEEKEEEEEERFTVNFEELEALREQYRKEGEEQVQYLVRRSEQELANAKVNAEDIMKKARAEAAETLSRADKDIEYNRAKAEREGFDKGFADGMRKGSEHGYNAGVKQCAETLEDLNRIFSEYGKEKDALMTENRRAIFDLAMSIAEKITMTAFTQKSKNVLEKMIASAAKEFRKAKSIKVTMSKLDITEEFIADSEILQKCFPQTANVEYELLDNAERGTLLVEGDSEMLDAGVSTQLKMIEELGKGKFREKEPDKLDDKAISDAVGQEKPKKKKADNSEPVSEPIEEQASETDLDIISEANTEPISEAPAEAAQEAVSEPASATEADSEPAASEAVEAQTEFFTETSEAEEAAEEAAIDNVTEETMGEMSETELADAADLILAQAGLGTDITDSEDDMELSSVSSVNDKISLTKTPIGDDEENS